MITNAFVNEPLDLREEKIESAHFQKFIGLTYWPPEIIDVKVPGADPAIQFVCKFEDGKKDEDQNFVYILHREHSFTNDEVRIEVQDYINQFYETGHIENPILLYKDLADMRSEKGGVCTHTVRVWRFADVHPAFLCMTHSVVSTFYNKMIRAGDEPWTDPNGNT